MAKQNDLFGAPQQRQPRARAKIPMTAYTPKRYLKQIVPKGKG